MPVDTTLTPRCGSAAAATETTVETAADQPDDAPTISAPAPQPGIVSRALDGLKRRAFPGSSPPASAAQQPAEPGPGPVSSSNGQPSTADPFARLRDVFTSSSPNAARRPPATSQAPSAPLAAQVTNDATFQFEPPGTSPAPADVRSVALSQSRRPSSALPPAEAGQQLEALAQGSSSRGQQRNRQLLPSVPGRSSTPEPQAGRLELLGQRSIPHQGSVQQAVVLTTQPIPQQQRQLGPPAMAHTSPFAKPSAWGTAAMIESLQPQATCTVCLDEGYALVTVSCLHRLCVDCARRVVATLKDHPLSCPVCRQLVRGFHAPNDLAALPVAGTVAGTVAWVQQLGTTAWHREAGSGQVGPVTQGPVSPDLAMQPQGLRAWNRAE
ncbi:hypothetical protein QJQ45_014631 [Haematococcus lacustris]|nr:hypothetical protein QJQ45_014631 [Haematococcus lacustris]